MESTINKEALGAAIGACERWPEKGEGDDSYLDCEGNWYSNHKANMVNSTSDIGLNALVEADSYGLEFG